MSLNLPWIAILMLSLGVTEARNLTTLANTEANPLCEQDVSALPLFPIRGIFTQPESLRERALQPALRHIQASLCQCLPRRIRHQPIHIPVMLWIQPNAGEIRVEYTVTVEPPWTQPVQRMIRCLGEPTLEVEPMPYASDMLRDSDRTEETLGYPILVDLEEGIPWRYSFTRGLMPK